MWCCGAHQSMIARVVYSGANSRRRQNGQFDVVAVPEIADIVAHYIDTNFESIEEFTNNLTPRVLLCPPIEMLWTRSPILAPGSRINGILPSFPAQAGSVYLGDQIGAASFCDVRCDPPRLATSYGRHGVRHWPKRVEPS